MTAQIAGFDVEHLHGPEEISYTENELIVVCLVRDGLPWVSSFVEHYFSLGVKHIVFLDNGSTDGTVDACSRYDGVTVLRTKAPYKEHEGNMTRYLVDRFGQGRWILSVDIDEFFDYPYSDVVALDSLLGYLNNKSYTAVMARMLDMFPENLLSDRTHELVEAWKEEHRFYDISGLKRSRMSKDADVFRNNIFDSDEVAVAFRGGIRETLFGYTPWLTKYPLLFSDGKSRRDGAHNVCNARVADFSCVLFHYKFYAFSLQEYWHTAIKQKRDKTSPRRRHVYEQYLKVLEKNLDLQLKRETSREISSVNELLENRFLVASEDYVSWVNAEEERSLSQAPQSAPPAFARAFLQSRRKERAKSLTVGRLEQRLLDLEQQMSSRDQRVQRLEEQLHDRGQKLRRSKHRQQRLTEQLRRSKHRQQRLTEKLQRSKHRQQHLTEKLQRSKHRQQRLANKIARLQQELERVRASRLWKLAGVLRHIKVKLGGLRRSLR
jgi:hypothetical protein